MKKTIRFLLAAIVCWLLAAPVRGQGGRMSSEGSFRCALAIAATPGR